MTQQKWFLSNPSRARSSLWGVLPYLCPLSAPAERTPRPLKGAARSTEGKRAPRRSARRVREKKGLNFFDLRRRKKKKCDDVAWPAARRRVTRKKQKQEKEKKLSLSLFSLVFLHITKSPASSSPRTCACRRRSLPRPRPPRPRPRRPPRWSRGAAKQQQ